MKKIKAWMFMNLLSIVLALPSATFCVVWLITGKEIYTPEEVFRAFVAFLLSVGAGTVADNMRANSSGN